MEEQPKPVKLQLREDWKIIKVLNWTGVTLASAGPYDFNEQKVDNFKSYRLYVYIVSLIIILGYVFSLIGRFYSVYTHMSLTTATLDVLSFSTLTFFNLFIIFSSIFDLKLKEEIFTSLIRNDMYLHTKKEEHYKQEVKTIRITSSLLSAMLIIITIFDGYVWMNIFEPASFKYFFFNCLLCIVPIYFIIYLKGILKLILNRFKSSTGILLNLVREMHKIPVETANDNNDEKWARVSQKVQPRREDIMQLKLLSRIFAQLFDSFQLIKKSLELKLLFFFLATFMQVMKGWNYFVAWSSGALTNETFSNVYFLVLNITWVIFFLILSVLTVNYNVCLQSETRIIAININKTLLEMPSEELLRDEAYEELIVLNQQFMHRQIVVNGIFFNLDYEFLFNTFITITSFSPVIIQFNRI